MISPMPEMLIKLSLGIAMYNLCNGYSIDINLVCQYTKIPCQAYTAIENRLQRDVTVYNLNKVGARKRKEENYHG